MDRINHRSEQQTRVYRFRLPPLLGLLLMIPLGIFFVSFVAAALLAAAAAAIVLPWFLRRKTVPSARQGDSIELSPRDYRRIDDPK